MNMMNMCSEVYCESGNLSVRRMSNASEWEDRSTGCVEFVCDNESGAFYWWSKCNSTQGDGVTRMCENNECVEVESDGVDGYVVEIVVEGMNASNLNMTEVEEALDGLADIASDKMTIRAVIDDDGNVVRIYVILDDEDSAVILSEAVNRASEQCNNQDATNGK